MLLRSALEEKHRLEEEKVERRLRAIFVAIVVTYAVFMALVAAIVLVFDARHIP